MDHFTPVRVLVANGSRELGREVIALLEADGLVNLDAAREDVTDPFSNRESRAWLGTVRNQPVFVIGSTHPDHKFYDRNLWQFIQLLYAARIHGAAFVVGIIPCYGYGREDKRDVEVEGRWVRTSLSAKLAARVISTAGPDRVILFDPHADLTPALFDMECNTVYVQSILRPAAFSTTPESLVFCGADKNAAPMARSYARHANRDWVAIDKRRTGPDQLEDVRLIGNVDGRPVAIVDDIICSAGTMWDAAKVLKEHGATNVQVAAAHGDFCGQAVERLGDPMFDAVHVTNTIPIQPEVAEALGSKLHVHSIAPLLRTVIVRVMSSESLVGV